MIHSVRERATSSAKAGQKVSRNKREKKKKKAVPDDKMRRYSFLLPSSVSEPEIDDRKYGVPGWFLKNLKGRSVRLVKAV